MTLSPQALNRRTALKLAAAGAGAAVVGLGASCDRDGRTATTVGTRPAETEVARTLTALEGELPGRLGVLALDTGSGATIGHRSDERFLLCSTGKVLTVAAVQRLSTAQPDLLSRRIRYGPADLLDWAPVTARHVGDGMTVAELCDAAITVSDNTAANLLVESIGGPAAVTDFARSLGDTITRVDRLEPDLNVTSPGDLRDTSTPAQMAHDLHDLVLGDALSPPARDRLAALLKANTTGNEAIRAGVPADWLIGDKTGSGAQGESNDIAVAWPPGRPPLVIAIYTAPSDPHVGAAASHAIIARAAHAVTSALTAPAGG